MDEEEYNKQKKLNKDLYDLLVGLDDILINYQVEQKDKEI